MQPNIDTLCAPLSESSSVSLSVASPSTGRFCLGCNAPIEHRLESARYCSKQCAKNACKRRATARKAIIVEFKCPYCGKFGHRRKTCGTKVVTCGDKKCVNQHKNIIRIKSRREWKLKVGSEYLKEYNKKYRKDDCLCGNKKHIEKPTCAMCKKAIANAVRLVDAINGAYYGTSKCASCGVLYERKTKHQVCCSRKCHDKRKQERYIKNGKMSQWMRTYRTKARLTDPTFSLKHLVRNKIREGLFGFRKNGKTFDRLGYTPDQLRDHLERQFVFGMGWHNYGTEWHVDHIKPLAMHRFKSARDVYRAWRLSNLQPRYATNAIAAKYGSFHEGNIEKGDRYVG